jgi:hypothetical protein
MQNRILSEMKDIYLHMVGSRNVHASVLEISIYFAYVPHARDENFFFSRHPSV